MLRNGGSYGGRTYRADGNLLPIILPCNLLASLIARTISREPLYPLAVQSQRNEDRFDIQDCDHQTGIDLWTFKGDRRRIGS